MHIDHNNFINHTEDQMCDNSDLTQDSLRKLSLFPLYHQYIQICPAHSAAGVRAHSCRLFQAFVHIATEPLSTTQILDLDL